MNRFGDQSQPKAVRGKRLPAGKSYTSQGDTSSTGESSSDEPDNESEQGLSDKEANMNSGDELELPELPDPMMSTPTKKTKRPRDVWNLNQNGEGSSSTNLKSKTSKKEKYQKGSFVVARYYFVSFFFVFGTFPGQKCPGNKYIFFDNK